jgi:hypothetical protein
MLKPLSSLLLSAGLAFGVAPVALAQTAVHVDSNGVLTASTASQIFDNMLGLAPGGTATGFSFSGSTGSFSQILSANGYYYAAYLFCFQSTSDLDGAMVTLNNATGVTDLSERLYRYTGSILGDASAGSNLVQSWASAVSVAGVSVANLNARSLTGGAYVLEIRGRNQGNFAGTLSFTSPVFTSPVPEPETVALLLSGLGLLASVKLRRRLSAQGTVLS